MGNAGTGELAEIVQELERIIGVHKNYSEFIQELREKCDEFEKDIKDLQERVEKFKQ
jgi:archaellum component FlaC